MSLYLPMPVYVSMFVYASDHSEWSYSAHIHTTRGGEVRIAKNYTQTRARA